MDIPASMGEQISDLKSLEISYRNLHNTADIIYNKNITGDNGGRKYKYNPKRLSYDIYSTTELWFELLRLNYCSSITEFTLKNNIVNVYNVNQIKDILNEIMILEGII